MKGKNPINQKIRNYISFLIVLLVILSIFLIPGLATNTNSNPIVTSTEKILCEGTALETTAYFFSVKQNGPTVMILSGVHGDEFAGVEATREFINSVNEIAFKRGTIILIPEANKEAVANRVRAMSPDEDLNRNYPGDPASAGITGLAGEIFKIMTDSEVDFLLDLHESVDYYQEGASFYGQTIVLDEDNLFLKEVANYLIKELNSFVVFPKNLFQIIQKPIEGSSTYESMARMGIPGITFETCTKIEYRKRVYFHQICIEKILNFFDIMTLQ